MHTVVDEARLAQVFENPSVIVVDAGSIVADGPKAQVLEALRAGRVKQTRLQRGVHPLLDKSALEAAQRAQFTPGKQRDIPVEVWVTRGDDDVRRASVGVAVAGVARPSAAMAAARGGTRSSGIFSAASHSASAPRTSV